LSVFAAPGKLDPVAKRGTIVLRHGRELEAFAMDASDGIDPFYDLREANPEALLADGLEPAYVGYTVNHHHAVVAVYDYDKCVETLVERDGISHEEADEFLQYNGLGAYVGENGPLFIQRACHGR
jgi:hypothetical protein